MTSPEISDSSNEDGASDQNQGRTVRRTREPQNHRTVDRVTRILEEVVYNPGMTFAELARALEAPKSSVYGFLSGLLAKGWLYQEGHQFYLGPAVYGLALASGNIRAGSVTDADLDALHQETGLPVFLGVAAGDHLIYVAETGGDTLGTIDARSNIRRTLLATAGGKALLATRPTIDLKTFLRRRRPEEADLVERFLDEYDEIRTTQIATNIRLAGKQFAVGTAVRNRSGDAVAAITLIGRTAELQPRAKKVGQVLKRHVESWRLRRTMPREAV